MKIQIVFWLILSSTACAILAEHYITQGKVKRSWNYTTLSIVLAVFALLLLLPDQ